MNEYTKTQEILSLGDLGGLSLTECIEKLERVREQYGDLVFSEGEWVDYDYYKEGSVSITVPMTPDEIVRAKKREAWEVRKKELETILSQNLNKICHIHTQIMKGKPLKTIYVNNILHTFDKEPCVTEIDEVASLYSRGYDSITYRVVDGKHVLTSSSCTDPDHSHKLKLWESVVKHRREQFKPVLRKLQKEKRKLEALITTERRKYLYE